jgi:hypothetical protein
MIDIFRQKLTKLSFKTRHRSVLAACFILAGMIAGLSLGKATQAHATVPPAEGALSKLQESINPNLEPTAPVIMTSKQRQAILKSNFEKIKKATEELATLTKSLQDEVDKSNENVLSLKIVEKAEKIENLAKKIRNTAKGE